MNAIVRNPAFSRHPELQTFQDQWGIKIALDSQPISFRNDEWKRDYRYYAQDAIQSGMVTTSNAGIPSWLTTTIDPEVIEVLLTPNMAAEIVGERQRGSWVDQTAMFPMVEHTGKVSSYGDFNTNGRAGLNMQFPQRQAYLYQIIKEYGELEMDRAGLAQISWASEIDKSAVIVLNKFQNRTYFFGVSGLQNYGLLNDPSLSAPLTPRTKAGGGTAWINSTTGEFVATANEVYADIQALVRKVINQCSGTGVDAKSAFTLCMSPDTAVALTITNTFNVGVEDLLKKNFPNLKTKTAVQYGRRTTSNPEGNLAGEEVQIFADSIEGVDTAYCAFNEKLRSHPVIRDLSSFKQKQTQGSWGAIIRRPIGVAQMVGV